MVRNQVLAVAGGLGVEVGHGYAADFAVQEVRQQGRPLRFQRQAGGGEVGGDEKVVGLILGDVFAQAQLAGDGAAQPTDRVARFLEAAGHMTKTVRANPSKGEPGKAARDRAAKKAAAAAAE